MSVLDAALYYADKGFSTLPLYNATRTGCACGKPDCASPGKHPWTPNGLKNASSDADTLRHLFTRKETANIGIVTGPISNIFVVDIDGPTGESSLSNYPTLPDTLTSTTGRGRHLFFQYPQRKVYTRAGKFAPGLDIRGEGGYVVAPPSIHHTGVPYEFIDDETPIAEAPDWLLDIICKEPAERSYAPIQDQTTAKEWSVDEVRQMLSFIDPDCGYDEWIEIGMALHSEGYGLSIWDEWSARGTKYKPGCTIPHWRSFRHGAGVSFGTLVYHAGLSGWKPIETNRPLSLDDHPAREFILRLQHGEIPGGAKPNETAPQLFDPLKIPGLVGDTVREIVETSQKPQPELALLNTLAALGAVFGRRYASPMDTRTNLYTVGIAVTAAGKDHSRRFIKRLMGEAKLESFLGEDTIISGAGLLTSIEKRPAQIMHLDEFGMLLEAITDQRGAAYLKAASKIITEMYSTSGGVFFGGQYADKKSESARINAPNLCIYGTTTPEKYIASMNKAAISSGELNRFIVIRPAVDRPKRRRYMGSASPSSQLISQWAALIEAPILNNSLITPDVIPVSWSGLDDRIWNMGLLEDERIASYGAAGPLWGRYRENVIKVAMIFAIARSGLVPVINGDDLDMAEAIVSQAIEYAVDLANNHMADSEHEKDCNELMSVIRAKKDGITKTEICRATRRMDIKQRDNALKSLLEQDIIYVEKIDTGGRGKTWYFSR